MISLPDKDASSPSGSPNSVLTCAYVVHATGIDLVTQGFLVVGQAIVGDLAQGSARWSRADRCLTSVSLPWGMHITAPMGSAPFYLALMPSERSRTVTCPAAWLGPATATICLSPQSRQWSRSGHTVRVPGRAGGVAVRRITVRR